MRKARTGGTLGERGQMASSQRQPVLSYPPCYALVSGGKDSFTQAKVLQKAGKLIACVAIETHISTPDWKQFLEKTCDEHRMPLEFYQTNESYENLVIKYGFPGPSKHSWFMRYLKGRGIKQFKKYRPGEVLASGVRQYESVKRAASVRPFSMWEGVPVLAPIFDWTTEETWAYFNDHFSERAPAYATLQISGDCLCGSYANEGEFDALKFHYPEIGKQFTDLGESIKHKHPTRCQWGWASDEKITQTAEEAVVCFDCPRNRELELAP